MKKKPAKRYGSKRKYWSAKRVSSFVVLVLILLVLFTGWHFRNGLAYYLGFKSDKVIDDKEAKHLADVRNYQILNCYRDKVVGIDVSEYQGKINWNEVHWVENNFPIQFVFMRATVGKDRTDRQFETNWKRAKDKLICGAYHYYRPNENSIEQADNFIRNVKLRAGDLPPVLDIEAIPKDQSIDSLKVGLKRWLKKVDAHYKVKPIIYTNEKYYEAFLKEEFCDYTFWIANYSFFSETLKDDWLLWQFTESGSVSGIEGKVDINIYNGTTKMLQYMTLSAR